MSPVPAAADYLVAIPARYASSRFPGKPLAEVGGLPMIRRVCLQARQSRASRVILCTDHQAVAEAVAGTDTEVCMTPADLASGTDRIGYMLREWGIAAEQVVVNVQGDEPLISPAHIEQVAQTLLSRPAEMASLCAVMDSAEDVFDPNIVKVVLDHEGFALYFSRAPIPYERDYFGQSPPRTLHFTHYHHYGLYAYRAQTVLRFLASPACDLERCEMLEQLRLLHQGGRIAMAITADPPQPGIDTPEDLRRVNAFLAAAAV